MMLTEYEWRRKRMQGDRYAACWGAQCVYRHARWRRYTRDRRFQRALLLSAIGIALLLPFVFSTAAEPVFAQKQLVETHTSEPRAVSAVDYALPQDIAYKRVLFSKNELLKGKMLLVDEEHPLPSDAPTPNTFSIAQYGSGEVSVRSLSVKSGRETVTALRALFDALRKQGITNVYVAKGTTTVAEQTQQRIQYARESMKTRTPSQAALETLSSTEKPGTGSLLQEHAVEIRLWDSTTRQADERPLSQSSEGQKLLQLAWRFGFICEDSAHPYRFRYVGKAHATAMTYLDLELQAYLEWLQQKGQIVIREGGVASYLIVCTKMDEAGAMVYLPETCIYEASADNMGYAVIACVL